MKKLLKSSIALTSLALTLAACGAPANPTATNTPAPAANSEKKDQPAAAPAATAAATAAKDPKDISGSIKYSFWGDPATKELHINVVNAFMKKYPNIKVEPVHILDAEYLTKIQTQFAGGTQPDLINFSTADLISFAASGVLEPVTQWVKRDWDKENLGDNFDRMMKALEYNGEQYALPRNASGRTIFYNKDMFDAAGVPYPDSSWTWDKFAEAAQKLTKNDNDPNKRTYGFGFQGEVSTSYLSYIWQAGGDYFSADGKQFTLGSKESKQGLQYMHDLIYKYNATPNPSTYTSTAPKDLFLNQKVAMHIDAGSFIVNLQNAPFKWDVALLAQGPKSREGAISPTGLAIPKASKNKEAAWELEKFINGPEGQAILVSTGFSAPVRQSVMNDKTKFLSPDLFKVNRDIALEAYAKNGRVLPKHPKWTQIDAITKKYLQLYLLDKNANLDDTIAKIEKEVQPLLK
ncbi:ABC transporter substrate-binding protein [Paenibacillus cremeus]|uniref:Sugar ABC transporter substrate-binding protein n=1 Tax=Paenibacillus cremeus TaxID=2163881 RepID=A0A559K9N2_9BACL|nr:sugar ABC transporter substrate-binding protein [Paenibacillus cremeus]TVY08832.1 sugar ABC transporter substrate-binding protein [Paenibacillus cremeus]